MTFLIKLLTFILVFACSLTVAQDLKLTDEDLQQFDAEREPQGEKSIPAETGEPSPSLAEAMERYDELIDRLKAQLRQVRIEVRDLPPKVQQARSRLRSLQDSEQDLRERAYERVVFRLPHPIYEDFDQAIEEALERREIREELGNEIEANERAIAALEREREELEADLNQALDLKEEAREAWLDERDSLQQGTP